MRRRDLQPAGAAPVPDSRVVELRGVDAVDGFDFVAGEGLVADGVVEAGLGWGGRRRGEGAVGDGDVAFGFPERERGVRDVPDAEELGGGGGAEVGRVGERGADGDWVWVGHFGKERDV